MKVNPSEWQMQARAGCEPNIQKASFIERRLFFSLLQLLTSLHFAVQLCYKGMQ